MALDPVLMDRFKLGVAGGEQYISHIELSTKESRQELSRNVQLSSGNKARDVIAIKRIWALSWNMLPELSDHCDDGGLGVEDLRLLFEKSTTLSLKVPRPNGDGHETVAVLADGKLENTILRRYPWILWGSVSITLLEV